MSKQINANDPCPCGSGLTYIKCCADSHNKWVKNDNGDICKRTQVQPDFLQEILSNREEELGRPLKDDDKLFPDFNPDDFTNMTLRLMTSTMSNVSPAYFYIFLVEELLLSETNIPKITTADRILILNAVATYASTEKKEELLIPYKEVLEEDVYETLKKLFKEDDDDKESIINSYMDMLVNDAVMEAVSIQRKIGRNDPCPCGSGSKYKNCCGKV